MAPWGAVLEVAVSVTTLESPSLSDLLLWLRALQPPCGEREFDVEAATILSSLHWGLPAHVNCSLRTQERLMNAMWGWWREWWKASDQFLVMLCCHAAVSAALCEECALWACPIHKQRVCRPSHCAVVSSRHGVAVHLKRSVTHGSKGSCDSGGCAMTASVPSTAVAFGHHRAPALEH